MSNSCYGTLGPPVGGSFYFEDLIMAPLPKTCRKTVSDPERGVAFLRNAPLPKNFQVPERIPLRRECEHIWQRRYRARQRERRWDGRRPASG
jgi:hypothetical protein